MDLPDPRRHAYRDDLAAEELRGRVAASRYVAGERRRIRAPAAPIRRAPRRDAPLDTEALHGEEVRLLDVAHGWAWVQLAADRYVGYTPADALAADLAPPTHRVSALRAFVFPSPSIKAPPVEVLPMGSLVSGTPEGDFLRLGEARLVHRRQVRPVGEAAGDFVAEALRLLGTPYLWGGKTPLGLDCSGLVQLSLAMAGRQAPRDTAMQVGELGEPVDEAEWTRLVRGDLVFWPGHVGIMLDGTSLLHANAYHMAVVTEPLAETVARAEAGGSRMSAVRRLAADRP